MLPLVRGNDPQARVEVVVEARSEGRGDAQPAEIESIRLSHAASHLLLQRIEVIEDLVRICPEKHSQSLAVTAAVSSA